jgi:DnaJ homolog subfamily C member 27
VAFKCACKNLGNKYGGSEQVRVNLWDLAGPTDYIEVRNEFYKDAQGCLLVYDITNRQSFDLLQQWIDEAHKCGATEMVWMHSNHHRSD